jgi:phage-related protein
MIRKIIAYKSYYSEFISKLSNKERTKIQRALLLFETEDKLPRHYIKYIRDGIYEFRVNYGNNEFRLFFIYDGDTIIVLFNCFRKKTQKTPNSEIEKAIRLKNEYYEQEK